MLINYLKVTFRNLFRNRTYTLLNVGGMGIGLATGLMLLYWVQHEMSFNHFHQNANNLYRVNANVKGFDTWTNTPQPIATFARQSLPEVALATRVQPRIRQELFKVGEKRFFEKSFGVVDSTFFKVFDFPMTAGDPAHPFQDAKSIVLSETAANRFFGLEDPIGKNIEYKGTMLTVTGVMKDFPENSTYRFDLVLNNALATQLCQEKPSDCYKLPEEDWGNYSYQTWVLLQPNTNLDELGEKFTEILYRNNKDIKENDFDFTLQPLSTLHLYKANGTLGQIKMVKIFFAVALLILLLAAMNYVNLATAQAAQRVKEISVRKVIGAERRQLFGQFWTETAVMLGSSLVVALLLIEATSPLYQSLAGKTFHFTTMDAGLWKTIGLTFLGVWAATAIYPALLLSSFKPALALKGEWLPGNKAVTLRKGLIVMQFAASAGLLICAFIMRQQLRFMQEQNLGFDYEQVVEVPIWDFTKKYDFVKAEMEKMPGVLGVTAYNGSIFSGWNSTTDIDWDGKPQGLELEIKQLGVASNFLDFFKIPLVEGKGFQTSSTDATQVLLNEAAVKEMGLKSPVVGQTIRFHEEQATVIGVVKDLHMASMREAIAPNIFFIESEWLGTVYLKTTGKQAQEVVANAEKFWKAHQSDFPFSYTFLDERYAGEYEKENRAKTLFSAFSLVALLISCLGLFGLAMHAAERRTKEIGIRKVLGASVGSVVGLLSKDFLTLVVVALVIASPIAWLLMDKWLSDFAYRIEVGWWVFALTGLVAVGVAFFTVGFQSLKAALANPVKSLRNG